MKPCSQSSVRSSLSRPAVALIIGLMSLTSVGPDELGLVNKRLARRRLDQNDPIAFNGEAGYQAELLMPGLRFKLWPIYTVRKHPWVQVPAGEIGVVIAQVGEPLPIGAKSAIYKPEFGNFASVERFLAADGGQKGVQRPVLPPGTLVPIHPVAFLVLTAHAVYGVPIVDPSWPADASGWLSPAHFGLDCRPTAGDRHRPARSARTSSASSLRSRVSR